MIYLVLTCGWLFLFNPGPALDKKDARDLSIVVLLWALFLLVGGYAGFIEVDTALLLYRFTGGFGLVALFYALTTL